MLLQPLRTLAGVADGPHAAVEFAGDILDQRFIVLDLDVLAQLLFDAELFRQLVHNGVIRQRLEQRCDHPVAPLQRTVGGGHRAVGFELGGRRQQIDAVGAVVHHRGRGRIGIDDDQRLQLLHRLLHLHAAGLAVGRVAPEDHRFDIVALGDVGLLFQHAVDPAGDRNAHQCHRVGDLVGATLFAEELTGTALFIEARDQPVVIQVPHLRPMLPGPFGQTVIAGQCVRQHAEVGRTLHIVVAAEDVGAAAGDTHVAERQLEGAVGAGVVVADGVLSAAHAPDEGTGAVVRHRLGSGEYLVLRHAGHPLHLVRRPLHHLLFHLFHAVDPLTDELLVLPAVLEHVPEHAPDQRHVGTRPQAQIVIGVRRGARETWIDHDQRRIVLLLRLEHVLQRDRMRLGRVAADDQDRLGVVDIIVRVGHRTVAPGVGNTRDGGGVTDPGLVIDVVGAPDGGQLAE